MRGLVDTLYYIFTNDALHKESHLVDTANPLANIFFVLGSSLVFYPFAIVCLAIAGFVLRIPINAAYVPLGFVATSVFIYLLSQRLCKKNVVLCATIAVSSMMVIIAFAFLLSMQFLDLSYDGQAYHQEAIIQLKNGWNPIYEQLTPQNSNNLSRWINHYSKGVWIYQAAIFSFTNLIEAGKLFHFTFIAAAFSFCLSVFLNLKSRNSAFATVISFLIAVSPVSIYQSASFYLDGQLMSMIVSLIALSCLIFLRNTTSVLVVFFVNLVLLINTKLTAGIYALMFILGLVIALWFSNKVLRAYKVIATTILACIFGFLVIGFNPYVTNTLTKGHPLHPAMGSQALDYKKPNLPQNFWNMPAPVLLFASIFSRSDNIRGENTYAVYKLPFHFYKQELNAFTDTNAKEGGFGILFSGAIILSLIIFIFIGLAIFRGWRLVRKHKVDRHLLHTHESIGHIRRRVLQYKFALGFFLFIIFVAMINPAASLARFIPHMWLAPVVAVLFGLISPSRIARALSAILLIVLLANIIVIASVYYHYNWKLTNEVTRKLIDLSTLSQNQKTKIHFSQFKSSGELRFKQYGVRYVTVDQESECFNSKRVFRGSIIVSCN